MMQSIDAPWIVFATGVAAGGLTFAGLYYVQLIRNLLLAAALLGLLGLLALGGGVPSLVAQARAFLLLAVAESGFTVGFAAGLLAVAIAITTNNPKAKL